MYGRLKVKYLHFKLPLIDEYVTHILNNNYSKTIEIEIEFLINVYHKLSFGSLPESFFCGAMDAVVMPFVCMTPGDDDSTSIFFKVKLLLLMVFFLFSLSLIRVKSFNQNFTKHLLTTIKCAIDLLCLNYFVAVQWIFSPRLFLYNWKKKCNYRNKRLYHWKSLWQIQS